MLGDFTRGGKGNMEVGAVEEVVGDGGGGVGGSRWWR